MPIARKPLVLGFIGQGATSVKNATALLTDLVKAHGGKAKIILPATEKHWTEGIEAVADIAVENEWPLVLVTDDSATAHRPLKGYLSQATEKIKVTKPVNKVVQLVGAETNSKLIILWNDEDDDCYTALQAAEQNEVEAFDLCAGLHKLEFTEPDGGEPEADPEAEEDTAPDGEPEPDDLDDMDEAELQDLAETLGLDVETFPEWEDVRIAIREIRDQEGDGGEGGDAEDGGVPTADEVMDWDFPTLKQYAQDNGIEVAPRSKTYGYRNAITAWLEEQAGGTTLPEDDEGEIELPADDEGELLEAADWSGEFEGLKEDLAGVLASIDTLKETMAENLAAMKSLLESAVTTQKPATAPQKAAAPAAKAAPVRKAVGRPAPAKAAPAKKAGATPSPKAVAAPDRGRPLAPFMHLLGKKLTKTQAREIMIANASKGRGRPTEDERHLVAAARELVPQV